MKDLEEESQRTEHCVFCDIIEGKAPVSMVYDDEYVCSFMTIGPVNPGHVLVVPKQHLPSLSDLDAETGAHLFQVTMQIAEAIRHSGLRCEGINLFLADGEVAFQDVFHIHMHVIPRYQGDSFKIEANWDDVPTREELDKVAAQIQRANSIIRTKKGLVEEQWEDSAGSWSDLPDDMLEELDKLRHF